MIYALGDISPKIAASAWVAPSADVIGSVQLGGGASVWFGAVLRGDNEWITIGDGSNVQENAALHTDAGYPLRIGDNCTIGHNAIVHGCTIGDHVLIGMGAIIMNGAVIGDHSIVAAGALVSEGKVFEGAQLIIGSPAKAKRSLSAAEITKISASAHGYQAKAQQFSDGLAPLK
jgi:carbonic anhydrase/acetyltransferase-like protein (isoleucine patch superfamily)